MRSVVHLYKGHGAYIDEFAEIFTSSVVLSVNSLLKCSHARHIHIFAVMAVKHRIKGGYDWRKYRAEQVVLAWKIVIQIADTHPCLCRNVPHGSFGEALLCELLPGRSENLLPYVIFGYSYIDNTQQ